MKIPKIVIHLEGGLVQNVVSDFGGVDFKVIDHDIEGSTEGETQVIDGQEVLITQYDEAEKNALHIREVFDAKSNFLKERTAC